MTVAFHWQDILRVAAMLFFVMDPIGNIPVFNAVLAQYETRARIRIIARELVFALLILSGFLFAGTAMLGFLGLTQPTLNLAGGILLFLISLRMVFPELLAPHDETPVEDPFIVPLATPMIAGPSSIAILLLISSSHPEQMHDWTVALLLAWSAALLILAVSPMILKGLGRRGLRALERLMGMLLILLSVQMFLNGLTQYLGSLPAGS
jgi:multiple antibiotic resistance protein